MIILIGGEKGGTGKTTLATNLAAMRALAGHDVLLVDTDRQGSAAAWALKRGESETKKPRVPVSRFSGKGFRLNLRTCPGATRTLLLTRGGVIP